jgi:hypothetical protein
LLFNCIFFGGQAFLFEALPLLQCRCKPLLGCVLLHCCEGLFQSGSILRARRLVGWQCERADPIKELTAGVGARGNPLTQAGLAVVEKKEAVRSYYEGPKPADLIIQTDKVTPEQNECVTVSTSPGDNRGNVVLFLGSCFCFVFPRRQSRQ